MDNTTLLIVVVAVVVVIAIIMTSKHNECFSTSKMGVKLCTYSPREGGLLTWSGDSHQKYLVEMVDAHGHHVSGAAASSGSHRFAFKFTDEISVGEPCMVRIRTLSGVVFQQEMRATHCH